MSFDKLIVCCVGFRRLETGVRASQTDTLKVFDFSRDLKSHFEHQDSHLSKGVHHRSNPVFSQGA